MRIWKKKHVDGKHTGWTVFQAQDESVQVGRDGSKSGSDRLKNEGDFSKIREAAERQVYRKSEETPCMIF